MGLEGTRRGHFIFAAAPATPVPDPAVCVHIPRRGAWGPAGCPGAGAGRAGQGSSGTGHLHCRWHVPTAGELPRRGSRALPKYSPVYSQHGGGRSWHGPQDTSGETQGWECGGCRRVLTQCFPSGTPGIALHCCSSAGKISACVSKPL